MAPLWLMGLTNATFGLVSGFIVLPLPQMLAAQGVSTAEISVVSGACLLPGFWVFLLGPVLDMRFSRRWYAAFFAVLAGAGLAAAVSFRAHLRVLEIVLMMAYAAAVLSSNALGGWLAGIVPEGDGDAAASKLSAWTQVGLFLGNGGMAVLAGEGLAAQARGELSLGVLAALLGLLVMLPAVVFFWMPLPEELASDGLTLDQKAAHERLGDLFRDLGRLLQQRSVWLSLALFVLPTGSFAMTNLLGGEARAFHASDAFVSRMGGVVLSGVGAASCLLVPVLTRWMRALLLYLLIGSAGSVFTLAMLLMPRTPMTFALAFLGENIMQAMSFTTAVAICFETIGRENPLAATQFGLLTSATVLPIVYMGMLDGRASNAHGLTGMYALDGGLSLVACVAMGLVLYRWRLPQSQISHTAV
jgi:PAT family beta-lactamase induction signal transducer AmpG